MDLWVDVSERKYHTIRICKDMKLVIYFFMIKIVYYPLQTRWLSPSMYHPLMPSSKQSNILQAYGIRFHPFQPWWLFPSMRYVRLRPVQNRTTSSKNAVYVFILFICLCPVQNRMTLSKHMTIVMLRSNIIAFPSLRY